MPQIARATVKERAARLRQKADAALSTYLGSKVGSEVEVLVERARVGRTRQFAEVALAQQAEPGRIVTARVTASDGKRLRGEVVGPKLAR